MLLYGLYLLACDLKLAEFAAAALCTLCDRQQIRPANPIHCPYLGQGLRGGKRPRRFCT